MVQAGQVLVELANPLLTASSEEAPSAWEGAVAELKSSEAELQANMLNQEVVLTGAQFNMEKAQVKTEADEALAHDGLLSAIELKRSQLDLIQLKKTYDIEIWSPGCRSTSLTDWLLTNDPLALPTSLSRYPAGV